MSFRTSLLNAGSRPLRRLLRKEDGNVAIWFGLMIIPLIGAISIGVDFSRAYLVKSRLSYAIDAAALAGGGNIDAVTRGRNPDTKESGLEKQVAQVGQKLRQESPTNLRYSPSRATLTDGQGLLWDAPTRASRPSRRSRWAYARGRDRSETARRG